MNTWLKILVVTLIVTIPAVPLGQIIWPSNMEGMQPTGLQMPLLILLSVVEAFSLGLGISFILFGLPLARKLAAGSGPLAWASFISIAWFLVSWWPHDGFHRSMESGDLNTLIAIEYSFHITLIAAGAIVAYTFWRLATQGADALVAQPRLATQLPEKTY